MDRRKRKSKQAIFEACLQLVASKEFESITIQEITDIADVNRGTFYSHYTDKYDMLNHYEDELIEKLHSVIQENLQQATSAETFLATRYSTLIDILDCIKQEKQLFELIIKTRGSASLETKLKNTLMQLDLKQVLANFTTTELPLPVELFFTIMVSIFISLARNFDFIEHSVSSELLAQLFIDLMLNGPAKVLGLIDGEKIDFAQLT